MSAVPLSISEVPPGSPWWMFALAGAGLALHIGSGLGGIVAGYGAVTVPKGEWWHRRFGTVFVASMLVMGVMGAALAIDIQQRANIAGGILAAYLVSTGWMAIRRKDGRIGQFEKTAAIVALGTGVLMLSWGMQASASPTGTLEGYRPVLYYVFASFSLFFAALDLRVIRQGGISGTGRIARHIWRMCTAFFFATGSFFLGQQKVMPHWMHGSPVLLALALAPLGFMIYWLIRVRIPQAGPEKTAAR